VAASTLLQSAFDDGDRVRRNGLRAAPAARGQKARDEEHGQRQETEKSHVNPRK